MNTPISEREPVRLGRPLPQNFDVMVQAMDQCEQTSGISVLEHGQMVSVRAFELVGYARGCPLADPASWKLPRWFEDHKHAFIAALWEESVIRQYLLYHDCGKPYCRVEEGGKIHFPGHDAVSEHVWLSVGGDGAVGRLIADDMVIHTSSAEEIAALLITRWSPMDATTLLLAALAEIHANAAMFGGVGSTSFKVKWKVVDRRGNQICKALFSGKET